MEKVQKDYIQAVVLPYFQNKVSSLFNAITVLEANVLVEQDKVKDLLTEITDLNTKIEEMHKTQSELETKIAILQDKNVQLEARFKAE